MNTRSTMAAQDLEFSVGDEVWVLGVESGASPMAPGAYLRPAKVSHVDLVDVDERLQDLAARNSSPLSVLLLDRAKVC